MKKIHKEDFYWPLGAIGYADEIRDGFIEEAAMLGIITILWNRQDLALKRIFENIIRSKNQFYISAIWDRQPTHQAKRDILEIALNTARMNKRQREILSTIIKKTKNLADRRNALIHAEYVVDSENYELHAKISPPRSTKPARYQKSRESDLMELSSEIQQLLQMTENAWLEFAPLKIKRILKSITQTAAEVRQLRSTLSSE